VAVMTFTSLHDDTCEAMRGPCTDGRDSTKHLQLVLEQHRTLAAPRRRPTPIAWILFRSMDLLYGRPRTLEKFLVLELVARVPYQTWEHAAYLKITRHARETRLARRIYDRVCRSREQQDNEQWHLFILEDTLEHRGRRLGWFRFRLLPQVIAFTYYAVSWLMYLVRPAWSYRLNADFEDHAEHEYALFVLEHPELDAERCGCSVAADYGAFDSFGDVLRQICVDERHHKLESLEDLARERAERR
jgi:ubiquinol oxidase